MNTYLNKLLLLFFVFNCFSLDIHAQDRRWVQFSGMIMDYFQEPVEFAHVTIKNRRIGTIADERGLFSISTTAGDTIVFTCIGYKKLVFVFPDTIYNAQFNTDVYMETDTTSLSEINIYPWKNYQEFKYALINLELPTDRDMENAKRNTAYMIAQIYMDETPLPNASFRQVMSQRYSRDMVQGQLVPRNALLDPIAWGKFIKALNNGEFSNKNKKKKKQSGSK